MRHYENVWEEAEKVAGKYFSELSEKADIDPDTFVCTRIKNAMTQEPDTQMFGKLLFALCYLSKKYNINTWEALEQATTNHKIDILEDE